MNNENSSIEPVQNMVEIPEVGVTTPSSVNTFQTVDPTADFQTIDPTTTEVLAPEASTNTPTVTVETSQPVDNPPLVATTNMETTIATEESSANIVNATMQVPKATPVDMSTFDANSTRYNPVTGEEMSVQNIVNGGDGTIDPDAVNNEEKLKKVEIDYQPSSKGSSVLLVLFFIGLIAFVIFLPNITEMIELRKNPVEQPEEIMTGSLICKLDDYTTTLTRTYTREFIYADKKLQKAKFTTVIRGDSVIDEEELNNINNKCQTIRENVKDLAGITVSCNYEEGKVTEKESFDYSIYDYDNVSAAYTEAGGDILEFKYENDIDEVMKSMQRGGFVCEKKK